MDRGPERSLGWRWGDVWMKSLSADLFAKKLTFLTFSVCSQGALRKQSRNSIDFFKQLC